MESVELERYARHILLKEIGGSGQIKISNTKITMIGAGGLGSVALYYLVASGVGKIKIVDEDVVSLSNLQRQILFKDSDLGEKKVLAARKNLLELNPNVEICVVDESFSMNNSSKIIAGSDLILDGTDNFETKALICREAYRHRIPSVYGGLSQWEGQVCIFDPNLSSVCFDCIYPNKPNQDVEENCADLGIIGPTVGVIGSLMAGETIKWITSSGKPLVDQILIYDCLQGDFQKFQVEKRKNCPVCA
ncbi:MAG: HesA/MoeB/ThiF family protein [Paracoccaceae bacterium]|nr:HesA/MoeB/ThiF family protein [Paracoccaceae bacterium]